MGLAGTCILAQDELGIGKHLLILSKFPIKKWRSWKPIKTG